MSGTTAGPYSFINGTDQPSTTNRGYDYQPAKVPPLVVPADRRPVQVVRLTPMESSTPPINAYYQAAVTQWPTTPAQNFLLPSDGDVYPATPAIPR